MFDKAVESQAVLTQKKTAGRLELRSLFRRTVPANVSLLLRKANLQAKVSYTEVQYQLELSKSQVDIAIF